MTGNKEFVVNHYENPPACLRQSTHSRVGCNCIAAAHASATDGVETGATAPSGILMLGLPDARALGAASGRTFEPGEEPPWYKLLLGALAQNLSVPMGAC